MRTPLRSRRSLLAAVAALVALACVPETGRSEPVIRGYGPNTIGFTKDEDDVGYMDFRLSVMFTVAEKLFRHDAFNLFGSFTGRFGQYIATRYSSPVVSKRFNPKLTLRWDIRKPEVGSTDTGAYLDLSYAHESNGQSISTEEEYEATRRAQANPPKGDGDADYAEDFVSRGWDYLELMGALKKDQRHEKLVPDKWALYADARLFVKHGILQSPWETFYAWDPSYEIRDRKQVHGLGFMAKAVWDWDWEMPFPFKPLPWGGTSVAVRYDTGIARPFGHSTIRGEVTIGIAELPVQVWVADGFQDDLAQFNRRVRSYGVAVEIKPFWDGVDEISREKCEQDLKKCRGEESTSESAT